MSAFSYYLFLGLLGLASSYTHDTLDESSLDAIKKVAHLKAIGGQFPTVPPRRYDISDMGVNKLFHGWADVQGTGAANDYCRFVGIPPNRYLSCALAGTDGQLERNYNSATTNFDGGYENTWYMKDEDGDGRDDYCRCVGDGNAKQVVCTKAGPKGFYGSQLQGGKTYTFTPTGTIDCYNRVVRPEFGRTNTPVLGS